MAWVLYHEAVNEYGAVIEPNGSAVFTDSTASFSAFDFYSGNTLFHVRYGDLPPGTSAQVRVVLSGASSDAFGMDPPLVFLTYLDTSEVEQRRQMFMEGVAGFTEDFEFVLRNPDFDNIGELYMHKDGGDAITNFGGDFTFYLWEEEEEPGGGEEGECFWTDLVNAEQFCTPGGGGGGGEGEGTLAYATESPGNCGGSLGRFTFVEGSMNAELTVALAAAFEVTITGTYQDTIPHDEFVTALGDDVAGYVVFDDVSYPMTYNGFVYESWITEEIPALDATFGQWFRLDVDGTIFYGATPLTTNC